VPAELFVDTSAWYPIAVQNHPQHAALATALSERVRAGARVVTTNLVIAETHRLTLFRAGIHPALRALERLDASPSVAIHFATARDHAAARRWLEHLSPRPITYTDAISFAVMEVNGCRHVLGFDQDFAAAGFTLWKGLG